MDKIKKIYMLTDEPTGLQIVALYRSQLEPMEHSTTTIAEGYFVTKEQLESIAWQIQSGGWRVKDNILKEFGVEE